VSLRARSLQNILTASLFLATAYVVTYHPPRLVLMVSGGLIVTGLLILPLRWMPVAAFLSCVLIPVNQLPVPSIARVATPPVVVGVAWVVRFAFSWGSTPHRRVSAGATLIAVALAAWTLISLARTPRASAVAWTLSFTLLVLFPVIVSRYGQIDRVLLKRVWIVTGACLGCLALAEAFLLHRNPVFGSVFTNSRALGHWSTYRATTTLGHPLLNGAFFASGLILAVGQWAETRKRCDLAAAAAVGGGLLATGSRGGLLAAIVGIALYALLPRLPGVAPAKTKRAAAFLVGAGVAVLALHTAAGVRSQESEGRVSAAYRLEVIHDAPSLFRRHLILGAGPGQAATEKASAETAYALKFGPPRPVTYENGWIELLVGLGAPGLGLALLLAGYAVVSATRAGRFTEASAVVTYLVVAGTFNLFEGHRPAHIFLGLLLALAVSTSTAPDRATVTSMERA